MAVVFFLSRRSKFKYSIFALSYSPALKNPSARLMTRVSFAPLPQPVRVAASNNAVAICRQPIRSVVIRLFPAAFGLANRFVVRTERGPPTAFAEAIRERSARLKFSWTRERPRSELGPNLFLLRCTLSQSRAYPSARTRSGG